MKWGEYLWPFAADLSPDMGTCYKAFKGFVMKSLQIVEHRFGVEPEIVAKHVRGILGKGGLANSLKC